MDGVLIHSSGKGSLFRLMTDDAAPELCFGKAAKPVNANPTGYPQQGANMAPSLEPLWKMPPGSNYAGLPAALVRSNLYLWVDHSEVHQHTIDSETVVERNGYHAALLCFSPGLPSPQKVFLRFDDSAGCAPVRQVWMLASPNYLFLAGDSSRCKSGVWRLPLSQLEPAIAEQKKAQLAEMAQAAAAAEQARKNLLAKYDRNHNGVIDLAEREEALDDPAFIESDLDKIDANHNGWLDAEELAYFDPNTNKILDPKEEAGIDLAQHLLAERLLKEFDASGTGFLDLAEFNDLLRSITGGSAPAMGSIAFQAADADHDGRIDAGELETFLKRETLLSLQAQRGSRGVPLSPMGRGLSQRGAPQPTFKEVVESYWHNPGGSANGPTLNRGTPPGRIGASNGVTQQGKTQ
jgi:Ca2+-binding EF-hand superfamily protein